MTAAAMSAPARASAFLQAGHYIVSATPLAVTTILGSCVAVCFWDVRAGVGAINHYLLPYSAPDATAAGRYGDTSIEHMLRDLRGHGVDKTHLRAAVYGGASVFPMPGSTRLPLGSKNVAVALRILEEHRIAIDARR